MKCDNFKSQTERGESVEQEEWMRVQFVSCLLKWDRYSASLRRFQDFTYRSFSFIAAEENNVTQNILMGNIRLGTTTQCFFLFVFFSSTTCHIWSYLHPEIVQVSLDSSVRLDSTCHFNMDKHAPLSNLVTEVDNGKDMLGHGWHGGIRFKNTTLKVSMHSYWCSSIEVIVITKVIIIIITKSKNTDAAEKCSLQVFCLHLSMLTIETLLLC